MNNKENRVNHVINVVKVLLHFDGDITSFYHGKFIFSEVTVFTLLSHHEIRPPSNPPPLFR